MTQNDLKYLFATFAKCSEHKISPFIHKMAKIYPFRGRGFYTPFEWKIGYKVINKQTIVQKILIVKTAFYISGYRSKRNKYQELVWTNTRKHYNRLGFLVRYKSQVRSDPPITFLPIINFIFVILSKLWFKCPVYQFYINIHLLINIRQKIFLFFSMHLDLIF